MSYVDPEGVPPPVGAARVGADLRAARQRLGWELPDVAAGLRIRLPYLEAIEGGRLSELPGNAYAMGFVRTYATALGLDPDEVSRRFKAEAQEVNAKTQLTFPAPVPQRGVPAGAVVLLGILIAAGAYVGWYRYSGGEDGRVAQTSTTPPPRLAAMAPPPQSPQVASILPSSPPPAPGQPAPGVSVPVPMPVPTPVPVAIAPPAPVPAPPPVTTRLVLHAKSGGWVQVREKQGQVLLNRVLRAGESWPVPMKPQLLLTTSNAGAMQLLVDGVAAPPLGPVGAMRRDVPLDPDVIKAGKLPTNPTTAAQ
jgi:cytoskeleton protein RodZ